MSQKQLNIDPKKKEVEAYQRYRHLQRRWSQVRKMANQGAKKRKEENARHMARIRHIIIACNVLFLNIRSLWLQFQFT